MENLSHFWPDRRSSCVGADIEPVVESPTESETFDFEAVFSAQYTRVARVIGRLVQDSARSEELAVEVFLRLWRTPKAQGPQTVGWLYRTAIRTGLDELRRRGRRAKYEGLSKFSRASPTPEQVYADVERRDQVRTVLSGLKVRHSELLLLRSEGWSYLELAEALDLNSASIGTLLRRAQEAFRKEYMKRYGQERE